MAERWVVQFCHCHYGPFLDVARQYAVLFSGSPYKVLTIYLTGEPSNEARIGSASDEVVFLNFSSREVSGLKLSAMRELRRHIAGRNVALIIAHRFKPIYIACFSTRLPVIGVHHAFGDYARTPRRWFANFFRSRLTLLGVSNAVRDDIRRRLPDWSPDRIETLYNRLDVSTARATLVSREEARAALNLPRDAKVIASVGRLHPDKDQATLLDGFSLARPNLPVNTILAIAGSGPLEHPLKNQAAALGIDEHVRFLGQIPDIRRHFRAFDLFVLSSDHEPFGMVLLEAMAAGVSILTTDCGGAPEIIDSPEQLFRLRDSRQLADRLTTFFANPHETAHGQASALANERLQSLFSDDSARERFFALPAISRILPPGDASYGG